MKKGKIKQFFEENWGVLALIIWGLLMCYFFVGITSDLFSITKKKILFAVIILYPVAGIIMMIRAGDKLQKQRAEAYEKEHLELKERYKYYVDLVNTKVQEALNDCEEELVDAFDIDTSLEYLSSFERRKNWICTKRIVGEPDSFIIASCLVYSLIDYPVIVTKYAEPRSDWQNILYGINLDVAMRCAFQLISEPITYYKDPESSWLVKWKEEKHPKVDIVVPDGLIKDSTLYQRIISAIYNDDVADNRSSTMQFANLLHLIYLSCQKN